jgi:Bacterial regulatory protein, Fis family
LLQAVTVLRQSKAFGSLAAVKAEAERSAILSALAAVGGNRMKAAELLRIHRVKLHEKIKRHGIAGTPGRKSNYYDTYNYIGTLPHRSPSRQWKSGPPVFPGAISTVIGTLWL